MKRALWLGLLPGLALAATTWAQPAVPVVPVAPAAPPRNIWSFLGRTPEQKAQCKDAFCKSGIGKMVSSSVAPTAALTGGLVQDRCALKAIEDIINNKDKEGGAESAAAKIKKSEAEAKARRAAVRYLGTVDCSRFPDAQAVLIASLLEDTNECVRFEAALAFRNGCCCNKMTVKALADVVSGQSRIVETSERVKAAAAEALEVCNEVAEVIPPTIEEKKLEQLKKVKLSPKEYLDQIREIPQTEAVEQARQALADFRAKQSPSMLPGPQAGPARVTSVAGILSNAFAPGARSANAAATDGAAPQGDPTATDSKVVNALSTSRSNNDAVGATANTPAAASSGSIRRPFFDNLTRALKGKQTGRTMEVPLETSVAPPAPLVEPAAATTEVASPPAMEVQGGNPAAPRPLPDALRPSLIIPATPATQGLLPLAPAAPSQP